MPVTTALEAFNASIAQCDALIANSHRLEPTTGEFFLPALDREQITVAAFLNMFIAWETYLESVVGALLSGAALKNGNRPTKFASPPDLISANTMIMGTQTYFDYGNHQKFVKMVKIFFENGVPFEPHLSSIQSYLDDLRTMRNAAAHISTTTQRGLESLALRLLSSPSPGIKLYDLLTATIPSSSTSSTVFQVYRDQLLAAADLIARG